jgi:hypothetical protein
MITKFLLSSDPQYSVLHSSSEELAQLITQDQIFFHFEKSCCKQLITTTKKVSSFSIAETTTSSWVSQLAYKCSFQQSEMTWPCGFYNLCNAEETKIGSMQSDQQLVYICVCDQVPDQFKDGLITFS